MRRPHGKKRQHNTRERIAERGRSQVFRNRPPGEKPEVEPLDRKAACLQHHRKRQEVKVRDAVLEPERDEGGHRQHDARHVVDHGAARVRHPHPEADKKITENTLHENDVPVGRDLRERDPVHAARERPRFGDVGPVDKKRHRNGPRGVAEPDEHPVFENGLPANASVNRARGNHRVARVEFRPRNDDKRQTEREHRTAQKLLDRIGKRRVGGEKRAKEPAQRDVDPRKERERPLLGKGDRGFRHRK